MDYERRLALSFYQEIAPLDPEHNVSVVQHIESKKIFVKKVLTVYNAEVFQYIKANPIPGMPLIYELYEEDSSLTLIEQYITGNTLESLLQNGHTFTDAEIFSIILRLCDIVEQLHAVKPPIIHRDIKPSNIILSENGSVFLLDMNAAKFQNSAKNEDTELLGTQGYAAPEQYGFGSSGIQTDIYAIGMVINTLVSGSFSKEIHTSGVFAPIISKSTRLKPEDRYNTVLSLKKALVKLKIKPNTPKKSPEIPREPASFWPLPGFRTRNPLHICLALFGYAMILYTSITLKVSPDLPPAAAISERITCAAVFITFLIFLTNYMNVQQYLPLCRHSNLLVRIIAIVFFATLFTFIVAFILFGIEILFYK